MLRVEPAVIRAVDRDTGINSPVRYSLQGGTASFLSLNPGTGDVILARIPKDHEIIAPTTLVIKVSQFPGKKNQRFILTETTPYVKFPSFIFPQATQIDNPDRYALATVVVSREGGLGTGPTAGKYNHKPFYSDDLEKSEKLNLMICKTGGRLPVRFVLKDYQSSVPENTPPGSILLTAGVNKIDSVSEPRFFMIIISIYKFAVSFDVTESAVLACRCKRGP